jgi:hypothetical protein
MKKPLILLVALLLTGCSLMSSSSQNPDTPISNEPGQGGGTESMDVSPQPGDELLQRGDVYIDSIQMLIAESYPPQPFAALSGNLPDPCHVLRIVPSVATEGVIALEVYSLADPNLACVAMLAPFTYSMNLAQTATLASGHYDVMVNGAFVGEFDMP